MVNSLKYILIFIFSMSLAYAMPHNHSPPINKGVKQAIHAYLVKTKRNQCKILTIVRTGSYALGSIGCEVDTLMTVLKRSNGRWRVLGLENRAFLPERLTQKFGIPSKHAEKLFYKYMEVKRPKNLDKDSPLM